MTTLRASVSIDPGGLDAPIRPSALAVARIRRRLTVEEAAARAHLDVDQITSLEESRIWRFASSGEALAASVVYAASLGISEREARRLAGLPVRARVVETLSPRRLVALFAFAAACTVLAWSILVPALNRADRTPVRPAPQAAAPVPLPERWVIQVDVFNGTPTGNAAAGIANKIAGLAYRIGAVADASRPDYPRTLVYYPPEAGAIAKRLARELGVGTAALPGGDNPRRLVVIVGARQGRRS
jgi:LytR cell envelope-related transcriptional attenuator